MMENGYFMTEREIRELEKENAALGDEVKQWMEDYDKLKLERDDLNNELVKKSTREARDTRFMMDIVRTIELAITPYCVVDTLACLMNIRSDILTYLSEGEKVT
jgi:predicted nuclease with TOPRIM domain